MKYSFSKYLSSLLTREDKKAIINYIHREINLGIPGQDIHFAIRGSNGLVSFKRIDIYVNPKGLIFISSAIN